MTDEVDGTADEIGSEVAYVPHAAVLAVTPQVKASELVERLNVIREAMDTAMQRDIDYGLVPGTNKPTLFKPGAEKLSVLFQLDVQVASSKSWGPGDHLTVESKATAFHAPTGQRLGSGEGMCTTKEKRYAVRRQERTCPVCGVAAVIPGKAEYGGGWLCWKKRDGCGAKFNADDQAITGQPVGGIENPDLPDLWNTILKMAQKRARVDVVLNVTGASALFTQDQADEPVDAPVATDPSPVVKDVQRVERSDVTATDPWFEGMAPRVKPFMKELRGAIEGLGGTVPARVSSWGRVLGTLDPAQRRAFEHWLTTREEQEAEVPWAGDVSEVPRADDIDQLAIDGAKP